jgi:hypothetical protein
MKRKRRVSLQIEHREIALFASPPEPQPGEAPGGQPVAARPEKCPVCGAPDMLPLADAVATAALSLAALHEGMQRNRFHLHYSPAGRWWVCKQSLNPD